MTRSKLPRGRKPLPVIERLSDSADRVVALVTLLDWLLKVPIGHGVDSTEVKTGEDVEKLGVVINEHIQKFTVERSDLFFSLKVRNSFQHATANTFSPAEIDRAADYLFSAVRDLLNHVDDEVRHLVLHDPYLVTNSLPLANIEQLTDPIERLFALRHRLEALLALQDERDGRWRYDLSDSEHVITVHHRVQAHLPNLSAVSPERILASLKLCSTVDALSAEQRAQRPLSEYRDAIADLSHLVRSLEPTEHSPRAENTATPRPQAMSSPAWTRFSAPVALVLLVLVVVGVWKAGTAWKSGTSPDRPQQRGESSAERRAREGVAEAEAESREAASVNAERRAADLFSPADAALARARSAIYEGHSDTAIRESKEAASGFRAARNLAIRWKHAESERESFDHELAAMEARVRDSHDVSWISAIRSSAAGLPSTGNPDVIVSELMRLRDNLRNGYVRHVTARIEQISDDLGRAELAHSLLEVVGNDEHARDVFDGCSSRASGWWFAQAETRLPSITNAALKSKTMRLIAKSKLICEQRDDAVKHLASSIQVLRNASDLTTVSLVDAYCDLAMDAHSMNECSIALQVITRALELVPTISDDVDYERNLFTATLGGIAKRCGDIKTWELATRRLPATPRGYAKGQHWAACAAAAAGEFSRATTLSDDWRSPVHIAYFAARYGELDVYRDQCMKIADVLARDIGFGSKGWNEWALSIVAAADVYADDLPLAERRLRDVPRTHSRTLASVGLIIEGYARRAQIEEAEKALLQIGEPRPESSRAPEVLGAYFELGRAYAKLKKPHETLARLRAIANPAAQSSGFAGAAAGVHETNSP